MSSRRAWLGVLLLAVLAATGLSAQSEDSRREGLAAASQGQAEQAYELLAPWVASHPDDVPAASALAAVAAQTGRVEEAEALLARLPLDDPRLALLAADVALHRGEPRVAIRRLAAHRLDPPPALAREFKRVLGQAYVETGQPQEALAVLVDLGDDPLLALWRSRALFLAGDMEGAAEILAPLVEQIRRWGVDNAPDGQRFLMGEILIDYARSLTATGRAADALAVLEPTVTELDSRRAWRVLAEALVAAGRGDEARAALNRGAALVPKNP